MRALGFVILASALAGTPGYGQSTVPAPTAAEEFDHLRDSALQMLSDEAAAAETRDFSFERVPALAPEGASAAIDRVALALDTNVDGAQAGLAFSPAALVGSRNPNATAFNIFVGALDDGETRVGARYAWQRQGQALAKLSASCPFDVPTARKRFDEHRAAYLDVCRAVAAAASRPSGVDDATWELARAACAVPRATYANEGDRNLRLVLKRLAAVGSALAASASAVNTLAAFDPKPLLDCYGTEEDLAHRFRVNQWTDGSLRFGVSTHVDFFSRKFGFSPDGAKLPGGQVKAWFGRFDLSGRKGRTEWGFGAGAGATRTDFDGDYTWQLTPAVSLSHVAFSLTPGPLLEEDGTIRIKDGKVIPHAVIGFLASAQLALTRPAWQDTALSEFDAQAFIEFKVSETLSFRLGVPLHAELVTRAADPSAVPPITKLSKLQWTVPLTLITVLKL